ncbi:hypothetical protein psal_cds_472 [Pandoravirus salinus]|uniref:DUF5848 domain-containing protein n=1 Tax=Pandoravirus salinus TaxID=1349410 RepID=S4W1D7_9VIRU|nr:hypothetical protein psal_cds_472 [Pandoravirus salinus]AGO84242.1 hypothetical protein psal_cds_472 [Pandoravirus salinus]
MENLRHPLFETMGDSGESVAQSPALALAIAHLTACAERGGPASSRDRAFLRALTRGANLLPPDAGWASTASLVALYVPFWTALQAVEDARPGTMARIPWPPTPFSVYLCAAEGPEAATRRSRDNAQQFGGPYGPERAYGLAAASWDTLAQAVDRDGGLDGRRYLVAVSHRDDLHCGDIWEATLATPAGRVVASLVARPEPYIAADAQATEPSAPDDGDSAPPLPPRDDRLHWGTPYEDTTNGAGLDDDDDDDDDKKHKANDDGRACAVTDSAAQGGVANLELGSTEAAIHRAPVARAPGMLFEFGGSNTARHLGPAAAALEIVYGRRAMRAWPSLVCALLYAAMSAVVSDDDALCPLRLLPTAADRAVARPDRESLGVALGTMLAARDL